MSWFFAVLIVAIIAAVAVVASGRGGSLAETWDDRPDSRVQADAPMGADDLRRVRFGSQALGELGEGEARRLSGAEIERLWKDSGRE